MEKRNINFFNILLRPVCLWGLACLSLSAHAAGVEDESFAEATASVLGLLLLLWGVSLVAIVVLSIVLYRYRRKLRHCHEYLLRYINENMELKKHVPLSKRPYAFNPPEITPEEFIKIIDNMLKKIMYLPLLLLPLLPVKAQEKTDSLYEFRFVPGKDMFYTPYKGNRAELERLKSLVRQNHERIADGSVPIYVDGYCNSLFGEKENRAVARIRSSRVKSELIVHEGLGEKYFITRNHAGMGDFVTVRIRLAAVLAEVVKTGSKEENREAAMPPVSGSAGGMAAGNSNEAPSDEQSAINEQPVDEQPINNVQTTMHLSGNGVDGGFLSLRANLLRWATLTPDLGLEWRISRNVGILVNGTWTSWNWDNKNCRYALWKVSPEVRYYIGKEKRGYLGAMYHVGEFNYKLGDTGKQGDYWGGGITGGWQLPLNRALSLDFHAALGYTYADYDRYNVTEGVRVRQGSDSKNYWGINHLGITLVWKFVK